MIIALRQRHNDVSPGSVLNTLVIMIIYSITLVSKVMYYIQVTITHEDNGYKYDYRTQKNNQDIQSIQEPRS